MTLEKVRKERSILEQAIQDLIKKFEQRTGETVQRISYVDAYASTSSPAPAPGAPGSWYVGKMVAVDVRL